VREKAWLKQQYIRMKADGVLNVPHYEDSLFERFAERHGYDAMSPARRARVEAIYSAYAARAFEVDGPLATLYLFPKCAEPSAIVVDLRLERLRRRETS
jgi:hypothetical protein